ncbi:hypothetical protein GEMRC1_001356 [Eukaryota sp. GEM-RC1]
MSKSFYDDKYSIVYMPPLRLNSDNNRFPMRCFCELILQGWAVPSTGTFNNSIVLVMHNDHRKPRLTGDFSGPNGINANTKPVKPNLPRICDILEFLSNANFIGTVDLPKAFWQLKIAEEDVDKTTVSIPGMSISFKRACFGLKNVPAIFQNIMMDIFNIEGVFIYIDNIIIIGNTFEEYMDRLRQVLDCARRFRVRFGLRKCYFVTCNHKIKILGSIFVNKTRCIDESRISALRNLPAPSNLTEVRSLIGALNYIRDFIPNFSDLTAPLVALTRDKPKKILWTTEHDELLESIKGLIINHMALDLPSEEMNIIISTNASNIAVGGVIWQEENPRSPPGTPLKDRKVRPISFYSRLLNNSQQNWAAIQKELYAILLILTESTLEGFLMSRHLTIFTDHRNLAFLITAPENNRIVKRWIPIFSEYSFEIEHVAGEDNQWADMLSRVIDRSPIETIKSVILTDHVSDRNIVLNQMDMRHNGDDYTELRFIKDNSTYVINNLRELSVDNQLPLFDSWLSTIRSEQLKAYELKDPLFKNTVLCSESMLHLSKDKKILIPSTLRKTVLNMLHGLVQAGHPNLKDSLAKLFNSGYFWPKMKADMVKHVKHCPACQKTAPANKLTIESTGSLWADRPFARLNVDTIGPLPKDQDGNQFLLVFVDSFTRYTILSPLEELNSIEVAHRLVWDVVAIFGVPFMIHSDNGKEFANSTFEAVCNLLAVEISRSIPHFSQSNGLVERRHRDVLQSLRRLLVDFNDYDSWSRYIPAVQLQINATTSSVTGHSPYELMFGSDISPGSDPGNMLKALEQSRSEIPFVKDMALKLERLTKKREEAETRQTSKAPRKTNKSNPFKIGDLVLKKSKTSKLHGSYAGPFLVMSVDSQSSMSIKNLITGHVSKASVHQCKIYLTDLPNDSDFHKAVASADSEEHIVLEILDRYDTPDGEHCTVLWYGGETSSVPTKDISNTKAYSAFIKLESIDSKVHKPKKPLPRTRVSSSGLSSKTPVAKRTRNSKREKR